MDKLLATPPLLTCIRDHAGAHCRTLLSLCIGRLSASSHVVVVASERPPSFYTAAGAHAVVDDFADPMGWVGGGTNSRAGDLFDEVDECVARAPDGKVAVVFDSFGLLLATGGGVGVIHDASARLRRLAKSMKPRKGCVLFAIHDDATAPLDASSLAYMCDCTVRIHPPSDSFSLKGAVCGPVCRVETVRHRSNGSASYKWETLWAEAGGREGPKLTLRREEAPVNAGGMGSGGDEALIAGMGVAFKLELSSKEKADRDAVALPYQSHLHGKTMGDVEDPIQMLEDGDEDEFDDDDDDDDDLDDPDADLDY